MMIAKGTIVGGGGVDSQNCSLSVIFTVDNQKDFFKKQVRYGGNHMPLVYSYYTKELEMLAKILGKTDTFSRSSVSAVRLGMIDQYGISIIV